MTSLCINYNSLYLCALITLKLLIVYDSYGSNEYKVGGVYLQEKICAEGHELGSEARKSLLGWWKGALYSRVEFEVRKNWDGREGYGLSWSLRPPTHFKGAQTILTDPLMNSKQVRVLVI